MASVIHALCAGFPKGSHFCRGVFDRPVLYDSSAFGVLSFELLILHSSVHAAAEDSAVKERVSGHGLAAILWAKTEEKDVAFP
jgi:hypothetical protein